jgi:hypothetical protein
MEGKTLIFWGRVKRCSRFRLKRIDQELILKKAAALKSPFEKGGHRGICFRSLWKNPPYPPLQRGDIIYGQVLKREKGSHEKRPH